MVNVLFFLKDQDGGWHAPISSLHDPSFTTTQKSRTAFTSIMQASISGLGKADEETFLAWKEAAESGQPALIRIAFCWPSLGTKVIEGNFRIRLPNRRWKNIEIESAGDVISSWEPAA